ncbi:hypothetical protein [Coleofasciculus sp. E1-EBD-02]|uniref:hypothetical protein n=1 Tax=Coleofasciculus sp. E1-EBD-02 TaxID=3068481 RepID=UPI0032F84B93
MPKKTKIVLAADPGSSVSKFIYKIEGEPPIALAMSPEVAMGVSVESVEAMKKLSIGEGSPTTDAWLQIPSDSAEAVIVGHLARTQYQGDARLDLLKYEVIIPKFLAAIGVIVQRHNLGGRLSVSFSCLLPFGEYANKNDLKSQLSEALSNFNFRGQQLKVKLDDFICFPEGGGLVTYQMGKIRDFESSLIPVVMLGHRNSSLLLFDKGQINLKGSVTTENGFINLMKLVCTFTSGKSPSNELAEAIYQAGDSPQLENIAHLIRSQGEDNARKEGESIIKAIDTARAEHWRSLKNWLDKILPSTYSQCLLVGGVAQYFRKELEEYFDGKAQYSDRMISQIKEVFPDLDQGLVSRFLDVFALYADIDHEFEPPVPKLEREQKQEQDRLIEHFAVRN